MRKIASSRPEGDKCPREHCIRKGVRHKNLCQIKYPSTVATPCESGSSSKSWGGGDTLFLDPTHDHWKLCSFNLNANGNQRHNLLTHFREFPVFSVNNFLKVRLERGLLLEKLFSYCWWVWGQSGQLDHQSIPTCTLQKMERTFPVHNHGCIQLN